ncbi:MAG TPA: cupin domain-containing protein, partial [Candidatus Limnocylindrales bacterium]|nr:cupin domain-containing protein [Candidatus Limnocylindrales bacterium]
RRSASGGPYLEFLRVADLSAGLYVLPAGGVDPQEPHGEDELYHVIRGRAVLRVADEVRPVDPGTSAFVAAGVPHRFEAIEEDLVVLVVFGPAEGTRT